MLHLRRDSRIRMTQDGPGNGEMGAPIPSAETEGLPEGFLALGQILGDRVLAEVR